MERDKLKRYIYATNYYAPIVTNTTKATLASGFFVALCARDSGGGSEVCEVVQILKALWRFRARPLTQHSQLITALQTPSNYRPSHRARHISFE